MAETSGKVTRKQKTTSYQIGPVRARTGQSRSYPEVEADRHGLNDVKLASATPELSIFCCTQDEGFIQYGGFPQVVQHEFHIDQEGARGARPCPWPGPEDGTITGEMPAAARPPDAGAEARHAAEHRQPRQAKTPRRAPKNPLP